MRLSLAFALFVGCSDPRATRLEDEIDASFRADSSAVRDSAKDDASGPADSFSVEVRAARVELCPGDCTELTVALHGASGTASYAWDQGVSSASQHVCPTATTRYGVSVTDESSPGEFHQTQTASDSLTVSVRDCAPVAQSRLLCEWRQRFEFPDSGSLFRWEQPWLYLGSSGGAPRVAAAADGSSYLTGSFGKRIDLGAGTLSNPGAQMTALVHKLDSNCQPAWTRPINATNPTDVSMAQALAVDAQGNAYVAAIGGPLVQFDPLTPAPFPFATELLIQKFSPSGDLLYRSRFGVGPGVMVNDIEVDDLGQVSLVALVSSVSDFGSGPLGLSLSTFQNVVLMLDAQGTKRGLETSTSATRIEVAGDQLVLPLGGPTQFDVAKVLLGLGGFEAGQASSLSSHARTDFSVAWTKGYGGTELLLGLAGLRAGGVATLSASSSTESSPSGDLYHDLTSLVRLDMRGQVTSTTPWLDQVSMETVAADPDGGVPVFLVPEESIGIQLLDADAQGALQLAGIYFGRNVLGGVKLEDPSPPTTVELNDLGASFERAAPFVGKAGANDTVLWLQRLEWGYRAQLAGLGSDETGNVIVGGQARVPPGEVTATTTASYEMDVIVNRLRAN